MESLEKAPLVLYFLVIFEERVKKSPSKKYFKTKGTKIDNYKSLKP